MKFLFCFLFLFNLHYNDFNCEFLSFSCLTIAKTNLKHSLSFTRIPFLLIKHSYRELEILKFSRGWWTWGPTMCVEDLWDFLICVYHLSMYYVVLLCSSNLYIYSSLSISLINPWSPEIVLWILLNILNHYKIVPYPWMPWFKLKGRSCNNKILFFFTISM